MPLLKLLLFLLVCLLVAAAVLAVAAFFAAKPVPGFPYDDKGTVHAAVGGPAPAAPETLTIVTWNIAYGYGHGSSAHDYQPRDRLSFEASLTKIAQHIASLSPDVVLLQEVDFAARRSHGIDQLAFLRARLSHLPYAASAPAWSIRYLPYPAWPFERHLGRVASGNAILSRFPITAQTVVRHVQPKTHAFWYNAFNLRRNSQIVTLDLGGRAFRVANSHLEDTDEPTRNAQAGELLAALAAATTPPLLAVGGDLNAAPTDETARILRAIPELRDPAEAAPATFPAGAATVRIDHLFVGAAFTPLFARVPGESETLSDHLPLLVRLAVPR